MKLFFFLLTTIFTSLAFAGDEKNASVDSSVLQNIKLSDNFKGFALEVSGGYQNTDSNGDSSPKSNGVSQTAITTSGFDDSDSIYAIGGSYNFSIDEKYLLGIGFDYNLNDIDVGTSKVTNHGAGGITADWNEYELKDLFSVYIKPQLVIDEDKLIYAKLGYVSADLSINKANSEYVSSSNESMHGYTVGAGTYSSDVDIDFYAAKVGIGYQF